MSEPAIPEPRETGVACEACPEGVGRLRIEEEDGTVREWICEVCHGEGWLSVEAYRTWKLAHRLHRDDGE